MVMRNIGQIITNLKWILLCWDIGCRPGNGIMQCSPFSCFSISYATSYVLTQYITLQVSCPWQLHFWSWLNTYFHPQERQHKQKCILTDGSVPRQGPVVDPIDVVEVDPVAQTTARPVWQTTCKIWCRSFFTTVICGYSDTFLTGLNCSRT